MKIDEVISTREYILLTFDLNDAKPQDYEELKNLLKSMGFLNVFEKKSLPDNTYIASTKDGNNLAEETSELMKEKASSFVIMRSVGHPIIWTGA